MEELKHLSGARQSSLWEGSTPVLASQVGVAHMLDLVEHG